MNTTYRLISGLVAVVAGLLQSSAVNAQQRTLYQWNGNVDHEVRVVMQGRNVSTHPVGNNERDLGRARVAVGLPREDGFITVDMNRGRGYADVLQQPSSRNNYTAIVRIRDDRSGADRYQLAVAWRDTNDDGRNQGDWNRGRDRDRADDRGRGRGRWDDDNRGRDRRDDRGRWDDDDRGRDRRDDRGRADRGGWHRNGGGRTGARWTGRVDGEVDIRLQGRSVSLSNRRGNGSSDVRVDVGRGLPRREERIRIRENEGRGSVRVVQQPSSRNGYTAVIRVTDPQGGAGFYDFAIDW